MPMPTPYAVRLRLRPRLRPCLRLRLRLRLYAYASMPTPICPCPYLRLCPRLLILLLLSAVIRTLALGSLCNISRQQSTTQEMYAHLNTRTVLIENATAGVPEAVRRPALGALRNIALNQANHAAMKAWWRYLPP